MTQPDVDEITQLARRYRLEIDMGGGGTPDWQVFPAVKEFKPTISPTRQDDTSYDDDGYRRQVTTGMAWEVEAKASHRANPDTGEWNPVQEYVRTRVQQYGPSDEVRLRWYDRNGLPDAHEGFALVEWEAAGGAQDATDEVTVKFIGQGKLLEIVNPAADEGGE